MISNSNLAQQKDKNDFDLSFLDISEEDNLLTVLKA